jgi:hypothetical protein
MDAFSYLSVLLSIILGLAITQVLQGLGRLMQARARVTPYWPPVVLAVMLLVSFVQSWWAMFGLRSYGDWTFIRFAVVLLQTVFSYLQAALILPEIPAEGRFDLRERYFADARWLFAMVIAGTVTSLLKDLALNGSLPAPLNVGFHCFWIALSAGAMVTKRDWFHKLVAVTVAVGITAYIVLLFTRLPS